MLPHPPRASRSGLAALAALLLVTSLSRAQETAGSSTAVPTLHPPGLNAIVRMAVIEAHRRLGGLQCQQIFSDFKDASDHALKAKLVGLGQTGQSYLGWIWFVDGGSEGRCKEADVTAFTSPGSQVVRFCGDRFTRAITRRGIGFLATAVIHEELHSLGLGEDPPSSVEITRRVEFRCGL
jgi:hypothetical protein